MKRTLLILTTTTLFLMILSFTNHDDPKNNNKTNNDNDLMIISSKQMNSNNISTWYRNNGNFNRDPVTSNSGFRWLKNDGGSFVASEIYIIFVDCPGIGAKTLKAAIMQNKF